MKTVIIFLTIGLFYTSVSSQNLSGQQLLDRAIAYHDPNNNWSSFNGELNVTMETPNSSDRISKILINLPLENFNLKVVQDTIEYEFSVNKGNCGTPIMNSGAIIKFGKASNEELCDRAKLYNNYYTYLYGLPMKLKDEGTIVQDNIERKKFNGVDYLVVKVTYDKNVGSDVWYFYFNPKTFAMEIYQFFKTDDKGDVKLDSGEYILLTDETTINSIKIPKNRAWYYNKDGAYLGTDFLVTH